MVTTTAAAAAASFAPASVDPSGLLRVPARLLRIVSLPGVNQAAAELLQGAGPSWRIGWRLAGSSTAEQQQQTQQQGHAVLASSAGLVGHVALLQAELPPVLADALHRRGDRRCTSPQRHHCQSGCGPAEDSTPPACACCATSPPAPGAPVLLQGAPFGCLAPAHFGAAAVMGIVSCVPRLPSLPAPPQGGTLSQPPPLLLLLDIRALPGMEGGPVPVAYTHPTLTTKRKEYDEKAIRY